MIAETLDLCKSDFIIKRKKVSRIFELISYLSETFAKKGQNAKNAKVSARESFCP